jgi:hypothetical protein
VAPRGQSPLPGTGGGRFGRMFGHLPRRDPGAEAIEALADAMVRATERDEPSKPNRFIPAGYTYLGQFIDHDITFDPASQLMRDNDPDALVDFRTPRLDLDSLYGSGPRDQPYLYDWRDARHQGVLLLVGGGRMPGEAAVDLPRNDQDKALIGDARNDENVIVSQIQLLFLRFHNAVVAWLRSKDDNKAIEADDLLEEAQRLVRWHYQWIVRHDYLPTVAGDPLDGFVRRHFTWREAPFMPVEFSGAAFRFGHSMVRPDYKLNDNPRNVPILPEPGSEDDLRGARALPATHVIRWRNFFALPGEEPPVNESLRIDQRLSAPLTHVPPRDEALARLNLRRGRALGLPAGGDVAHAMGLPGLTDEQLALDDVAEPGRSALARTTPLWYWLLCEAQEVGRHGLHLGPVGTRLVAEVLIGLLEADPQSYLSQWPTWRPELGEQAGTFTMADLIAFTERIEREEASP